MKSKNMKNKVAILTMCIIVFSSIYGCKEAQVPYFEDANMLYIPNEDKINETFISFYQLGDVNEAYTEIAVNLIGRIPIEDMEYKIAAVHKSDRNPDVYTTARTDEYSIPETLIFRKGLQQDTIRIPVKLTDREADESVVLVIEIVENELFKVAFKMRNIGVVRYGVVSHPVWWNTEIEKFYLGVYSLKKYNTLIEATGVDSFEGLKPSEMRKYSRDLKNYIKENGITEDEEGNIPMIIPIY